MKKIFFILIFSFLLCCNSNCLAQNTKQNSIRNGSSSGRECDDIKFVPNVKFSTSFGRLTYDYSRSRQDIKRISSKSSHKESGIFLSGLATVSIDNEAEVGVITKVTADNIICVIPQTVNVYVGLSKPTIYVSKELKPGSCSYNLVMRHEQTHQRINKATLEYFIPLFQVAAQKIASKLQAVKISSYSEIDLVSKKMSSQFHKEFLKVVSAFKKELTAEQTKLDNQSNYKREGDICRDYKDAH